MPGQAVLRGSIATLPRLVARAAPTGPVLVLIGAALADTAEAEALAASFAE
jgi:siroheme synthase